MGDQLENSCSELKDSEGMNKAGVGGDVEEQIAFKGWGKIFRAK